jgi:hypothetical protein
MNTKHQWSPPDNQKVIDWMIFCDKKGLYTEEEIRLTLQMPGGAPDWIITGFRYSSTKSTILAVPRSLHSIKSRVYDLQTKKKVQVSETFLAAWKKVCAPAQKRSSQISAAADNEAAPFINVDRAFSYVKVVDPTVREVKDLYPRIQFYNEHHRDDKIRCHTKKVGGEWVLDEVSHKHLLKLYPTVTPPTGTITSAPAPTVVAAPAQVTAPAQAAPAKGNGIVDVINKNTDGDMLDWIERRAKSLGILPESLYACLKVVQLQEQTARLNRLL